VRSAEPRAAFVSRYVFHDTGVFVAATERNTMSNQQEAHWPASGSNSLGVRRMST